MARASVLKKDIPFSIQKDKSLGIQTYGENNDFPQQVTEIIEASATGSSCRDILAKFLQGRGFDDETLYKLVVNRKGQTMDDILNLITHDDATYNGYAIHVNFNANYKIREIQHVPFETVRLALPNSKNEVTQAALHWDWGKRYGDLKKWDKKDIEWIDLFNPDPAFLESRIELFGWRDYAGQIIYVGGQSETYPQPIYTSVLSDMNTEEGLANISNRNARNRFMLGGILVDIFNEAQSEEQDSELKNMLSSFQGDEDAQKIGYAAVNSAEEVPKFVPFESKNYDKDYTVTEQTCRERIGRRFNQPPILRAEEVAQGFSVDAMQDAYDYYNSVTEPERLGIVRVIRELFKNWHGGTFDNLSILALSYKIVVTLSDRLADNEMIVMDKILDAENLDDFKKAKRLKTILGLNRDEITGLGLDLTPEQLNLLFP